MTPETNTIPDAIRDTAEGIVDRISYVMPDPASVREDIERAIHDAVMTEKATQAKASEEAGDNMYLTAMWDARSWAKKWGYPDFADRLVDEVNKRAEKSGLSKMKV